MFHASIMSIDRTSADFISGCFCSITYFCFDSAAKSLNAHNRPNIFKRVLSHNKVPSKNYKIKYIKIVGMKLYCFMGSPIL